MFLDDSIAGSWAMLNSDLAARHALGHWTAREPVLAGAASLDDLATMTAPDAPPDRANQVLGAVVRIGARAGGDDPEAVLVALHLLSSGLYASAARLAAVIPEALQQLVAEAAGHIRAYPVDDRYTSYATQIVRNAEHALLAESYPQNLRRERVPVTPFDPCRLSALPAGCLLVAADPAAADPANDSEVDPIDLLLWAVRAAVISHDDVELLLDVDARYRRRGESLRRFAAQRQVSVRSLNRRRRRAESALRAALPEYLAAA
jgi:hypothetical protein